LPNGSVHVTQGWPPEQRRAPSTATTGVRLGRWDVVTVEPARGLAECVLTEADWLTEEEVARLLAAAEHPPRRRAGLAERDRLVLLTVVQTGLRRAELIALDWPIPSATPPPPSSIRGASASRVDGCGGTGSTRTTTEGSLTHRLHAAVMIGNVNRGFGFESFRGRW
jgi:hypothetical protein